jgi:hypothetical protein
MTSAPGGGSVTASEDDDSDGVAAVPGKKAPSSSPGGKKPIGRIGLGVIGGRAQQPVSRSITRSVTPPEEDEVEEGAPKAISSNGRGGGISGVGIIGGGSKKRRQSKPGEDLGGLNDGISSDEEPARQTVPRPAASQPTEKKLLARPAKKKRKF